ncbi:MAG: hypothetical protein O3C57_08435 [Verrucomicrobia bacterium]|nr:hypothetical protein [Verrucomicrobiota bacterium]
MMSRDLLSRFAFLHAFVRPIYRPGSRAYGLSYLFAALVLSTLLAGPVCAGKIVLRVQAGNPSELPQRVQLKSNLPAGVSTNHLLSLGGLEVGYDIKHDVYFVHKDVELAGKEIAVFDVEIDDIWVIDSANLDAMGQHINDMVEKLSGFPTLESAMSLQVQIESDISEIRKRQAENAISAGRKAIDHIRAYEANVQALKRVKIDLGRVENLVLAQGVDPGAFMGVDLHSASLSTRDAYKMEQDRVAIIRIAVRNKSKTSSRPIRLKRELPPEVRMEDVLDPDGLEVGMDAEAGVAYLFSERIELEPDQRKIFTVKIRDRWNVNEPRIAGMLIEATNSLVTVTTKGGFKGLEESLTEVVEGLKRIQAEVGPTTVNQTYVAFYRDQAQRLDDLEIKLNRVRMAIPKIHKNQRIGQKIKPPSPKTTWLIIYLIIGFLGLFSLLFFLRWYRRSGEGELK